MRWTWRRFGCDGSPATRERCFTVVPICASPSTPSPTRRRMVATVGLLNVCEGLRCTAVTTAPKSGIKGNLPA